MWVGDEKVEAFGGISLKYESIFMIIKRKSKPENLLQLGFLFVLSSNVCLNHHPNLYRASTSSCRASTSYRVCDVCDACPAFLVHRLHGFRLAILVFRSCTLGEGGACRDPSYALDTWCKYGEHTRDSPSR